MTDIALDAIFNKVCVGNRGVRTHFNLRLKLCIGRYGRKPKKLFCRLSIESQFPGS
jgi:hypothetical protein